MKKVFAAIACLAICLSMAACAGNPAGGKDSSQPTQTQTDKGDNGLDIAGYIAASQKEIDQLTASLKDSGMELKVIARGNSLVYSYQYTTISSSDVMKSTLDKAMESTVDTFNTVLKDLKKQVKSAESVIVEYLDKEGEVITSKEFK